MPVKIISKPVDEPYDVEFKGLDDFFGNDADTTHGQVVNVSYNNKQIILKVRMPDIDENNAIIDFVCALHDDSDFSSGINSDMVFMTEPQINEGDRIMFKIELGCYFNVDLVPDTDLRNLILKAIPKPVAQQCGLLGSSK